METDGSCDFVVKGDPALLCLLTDFSDDHASSFIKEILDASGIIYLSPENYVIELTTFVLLNCDVDIMDQFHTLLLLLTTKRIKMDFNQDCPLASIWLLLKTINVASHEICCTGCRSTSRCACSFQSFKNLDADSSDCEAYGEDSTNEEPLLLTQEPSDQEFRNEPMSSARLSDAIGCRSSLDGRLGVSSPPPKVHRLIRHFEAMAQPNGRPPEIS